MISPVGSDSRGFSLFELVLVLLLLGVSMAVVLPNLQKSLQDREVRISALELAAVARDLRSRALQAGVPQQLIIDLSDNSYRMTSATEVRLPSDVRFVTVDGGEITDRERKRFYFFPNGSSLGGTIVLADSAGIVSYRVRVDALSGRVEVARADLS